MAVNYEVKVKITAEHGPVSSQTFTINADSASEAKRKALDRLRTSDESYRRAKLEVVYANEI
jgi:hypothetical protein